MKSKIYFLVLAIFIALGLVFGVQQSFSGSKGKAGIRKERVYKKKIKKNVKKKKAKKKKSKKRKSIKKTARKQAAKRTFKIIKGIKFETYQAESSNNGIQLIPTEIDRVGAPKIDFSEIAELTEKILKETGHQFNPSSGGGGSSGAHIGNPYEAYGHFSKSVTYKPVDG